MKKVLFILAVVIFGCATMAVADSSVDWSIRSDCWYDDQDNCGGCYNYAAINFFEQSDSNIPKLAILLDGKNIGSITPQTVKAKKNVELENVGSQYFGGIPVYSSGGYNVELKNGRKVQLAGYVEIPELTMNVGDISATSTGSVSVKLDIIPLFGKEIPTGAAGITIAGALNKLGTISADGYCGDYIFTFTLSREEIILLKDGEVEIEINIAGDSYYSTIYMWSPYEEDYSSATAKTVSMIKAKKMSKRAR